MVDELEENKKRRGSMKLSEAMMLGSTMIKFNPNLYLSCGQGCLRGAAYFAATGKDNMTPEDDVRIWRWLANEFPFPPGTRYSADPGLIEARHIINAIAWMVESGEWTLEQAVDWVRSVEPEETTPVTELSDTGQKLIGVD